MAHLARLHEASDSQLIESTYAGLGQSCATGSVDAEIELAFHLSIAAAARNPYFSIALRSLIRDMCGNSLPPGSCRTHGSTHPLAQRDRRAVIDAIALHDATSAERAMRICLVRGASGPG